MLSELGVGMYSDTDTWAYRLPRHIQLAAGAYSYALTGVVMVVIRFVVLVVTLFSLPDGLFFVLAAPVVLAVVVVLFLRANRRADREWDSRGHINPSSRIRVHTSRWDPETLARELWSSRDGFEPEIAHVPLAAGFDRAGVRLAWLGGITGLLAGILVELVFPMGVGFMSTLFWSIGGLTILGAVVLPEFVFPTYLRILPGRIDVVRGSILGEHVWQVHSYDLRKGRVKFSMNAVLFEPDEIPKKGEAPRVENAVSLAITHRRKEIELAILRAATTNASTPDVPSDRLLG